MLALVIYVCSSVRSHSTWIYADGDRLLGMVTMLMAAGAYGDGSLSI